MVMLSDPQAIQALYAEPEHGLPPGRTLALRPIMGARSVLLLEGAAHLERRRVMLPPFHGERMRAYEPAMREIAQAEIDRWPLGEELALQPRMQAITLEVILRVVFGVTDPARLERLRELLPRLLDATSSIALSFRVMLARRLGRADPLASFAALSAEIDELLLDDIAARRRAGGDRRARRRPLAAARRTLRGRQRDERPRAARPARDAAARRPRDDRDRARLDVRPAAAQPGRARAPHRRAPRRARRPLPARGDLRSRCGCARWCRSPAAGSRPSCAATASRCRRAPTSRPRSGSRTRARTSIRSPTRSGPSASSSTRPRPTPGSRSAAASAAASAPRSPSSRCVSC